MSREVFTLTKDGAFLNDVPFYPVIGDIHYFRIYPTDWKRRLLLARDFGINVIQTYVPWNLHEPKRGTFRFDGIRDLSAFLALAKSLDLRVFLRASPYICSEWDFGGLPGWLLRERDMEIRCMDERYISAVRDYYHVLCDVIRPHLSTNGGSVIAMAVENEYGSFGTDREYIRTIAEILRGEGMDVPLYTTDGDTYAMQFMGGMEGYWKGANFRAKAGSAAAPFATMQKIQPDLPFFCGEWWSGRAMHWDEPFSHREPENIAQGYAEALSTGGFIDFYMFGGGTNFGFMSGANDGTSFTPRPGTPSRYMPHMTSYDEDALLSENGVPTEKYFLCRDVLDRYLGNPPRPHTMPEYRTQAAVITLTETASLFDNLDALAETDVETIAPKPMEDFGQSLGFILYSVDVPGYVNPNAQQLHLKELHDRAVVFCDGEYQATFLRERREPDCRIQLNGCDRHFDVLVENAGRINFGAPMRDDRKGILGGIYLDYQKLFHIRTRTLPFDDLSGIRWQKSASVKANQPMFLRGTFAAESGIDTFADMRGFGDGFVVINGFNVGRYRACGPQHTLYIPGGLLKEENEIIVFDSCYAGTNRILPLIGESILCAPVSDEIK